MYLHLLSLLSSSRTESSHYTRSLLNTLTSMLRLKCSNNMLLQSEQVHSSQAQSLLWSLPCYRHHNKSSLDECSAQLAMTYILNGGGLKEGQEDTIARDINDYNNYNNYNGSGYGSTRRERLLMWAMSTPALRSIATASTNNNTT